MNSAKKFDLPHQSHLKRQNKHKSSKKLNSTKRHTNHRSSSNGQPTSHTPHRQRYESTKKSYHYFKRLTKGIEGKENIKKQIQNTKLTKFITIKDKRNKLKIANRL